MAVFEQVKKEEVVKLTKRGFLREPGKTLYEELRLKKGNVVLVLYNSGKLLLQGPMREVKEVEEQLRQMHLGAEAEKEKFRKESGWLIGSDESLKGDTFGGLVVAAVKANEEGRKKLAEIGVADSKTLSDREIIPLAEKIRNLAACEVRNVFPEEYNHYHDVTSLLNKLHQECADYLKPGQHVVDKYPGCTVGDIQEERAESKYVEVAAASVLARAAALQQLNQLSKEAGFELPKGSTHVFEALERLKAKKLDFRKFVKMEFRNVQKFL